MSLKSALPVVTGVLHTGGAIFRDYSYSIISCGPRKPIRAETKLRMGVGSILKIIKKIDKMM